MEFPSLGEHCSLSTCRQLDFLPLKCDACQLNFCKEHFQYSNHSCPKAYEKDRQVPCCPLCSRPVPSIGEESPDSAVSRHIDSDCTSDRSLALRGSIYKNKCNVPRCKQREAVPVNCKSCGLTYCLRHRLERDHNCNPGAAAKAAGLAAMARSSSAASARSIGPFKGKAPSAASASSTATTVASGGGGRGGRGTGTVNPSGVSEDEALAMALQYSALEAANSANSPLAPTLSGSAASGGDEAARREQERLDEEVARSLQAEEDERIARQQAGAGNQRPTRAATAAGGNDGGKCSLQ